MNDLTTKEYSISDLVEVSGVKTRTIHFYIKEGLIESPCKKGGRSKYFDSHLMRLRLLEQFKQSGIKLSRIKEILNSLSDEEVRNHLAAENKDELFLFANVGSKQALTSNDQDFYAKESTPAYGSTKEPASLIQASKGIKPSTEEVWKRINISNGIEVCLRDDLPESTRLKMETIIEYIRHQFTDNPPHY